MGGPGVTGQAGQDYKRGLLLGKMEGAAGDPRGSREGDVEGLLVEVRSTLRAGGAQLE